jgi:hypothetical protein
MDTNIQRRQNGESSTDRFLDLIADPFQSQVRHMFALLVLSRCSSNSVKGPTKLDIRRHCLQLRRIWSALPRLLLPTTSEFESICATRETRRRETPACTTRQHTFQLDKCYQECQRTGSRGQDRPRCGHFFAVFTDGPQHLLRHDGVRMWHPNPSQRGRRIIILQPVEEHGHTLEVDPAVHLWS